MAKKLPILRRLEVALAETTSITETEEVYGLLGVYCSKIECNGIDLDKFYEGMNHKTLSVIQNRRKVSSVDIENGKNLAKYLKNIVVLPERGEKGYRAKMLTAMKTEFNAFNNMYCLKNGRTRN